MVKMNYSKKEIVKDIAKHLGETAIEACDESINWIREQEYTKAIDIGIGKTIEALYVAKVPDEEILRVVNLVWGIDIEEVGDWLVQEKQNAAIKSLRHYLKLQGYSVAESEKFMRENNASLKIRRDKDLWKLKDNPRKLFDIIKVN